MVRFCNSLQRVGQRVWLFWGGSLDLQEKGGLFIRYSIVTPPGVNHAVMK